MSRQEYRGRVQITSEQRDFNIRNANGQNINCIINTGSVFLAGYPGEAEAASITGKLQAAIRAQAAGHTTANVTYSMATGRVTIGLNHNCNIWWTDNALGDALGFAQNTAAAATNAHTGTKQPRYIWRPTRGAADMPVHLNTWWGPRSTSKLTRSVDGSIVSARGNLLYEGAYSYRNLPRADVICDATDTDNHRPLERFWGDIVHAAKEIRVYPDINVTDSSTAFKTGFWTSGSDSDEAIDVGPFAGQIGRRIASFDGLWDVDFSMMKNV